MRSLEKIFNQFFDDRHYMIKLQDSIADSHTSITEEAFDIETGQVFEITVSKVVDDGDKILGYIYVQKDITRRKELENTRRLTQLGKLIADVAHEVNNPLMVILGRAELALLKGSLEGELNGSVKESLDIIVEQCRDARDIIWAHFTVFKT